MELFWAHGPMFIQDLLKEHPDPKPHYNTVSTVVRGLEEKGFVGHEQFGNTHRYFASVTREQFSGMMVEGIVGKYFNHSYASLVSMFVEKQDLSTDDIRDLISQIESGNKK